ncbi:MAG: DUF6788 family protein, partial [Nitriliruptoraceae bacterium]
MTALLRTHRTLCRQYIYCLHRVSRGDTFCDIDQGALVAATEPPAETLAEFEALAGEIARLGPALPGTVTERYTRCTSKGCRCRADPPRPH